MAPPPLPPAEILAEIKEKYHDKIMFLADNIMLEPPKDFEEAFEWYMNAWRFIQHSFEDEEFSSMIENAESLAQASIQDREGDGEEDNDEDNEGLRSSEKDADDETRSPPAMTPATQQQDQVVPHPSKAAGKRKRSITRPPGLSGREWRDLRIKHAGDNPEDSGAQEDAEKAQSAKDNKTARNRGQKKRKRASRKATKAAAKDGS